MVKTGVEAAFSMCENYSAFTKIMKKPAEK